MDHTSIDHHPFVTAKSHPKCLDRRQKVNLQRRSLVCSKVDEILSNFFHDNLKISADSQKVSIQHEIDPNFS